MENATAKKKSHVLEYPGICFMINLAFHTVFIVSHAAGNYSQTLQCIKEQSTHQAESPVQWGSYRCSKVQHFSVS